MCRLGISFRNGACKEYLSEGWRGRANRDLQTLPPFPRSFLVHNNQSNFIYSRSLGRRDRLPPEIIPRRSVPRNPPYCSPVAPSSLPPRPPPPPRSLVLSSCQSSASVCAVLKQQQQPPRPFPIPLLLLLLRSLPPHPRRKAPAAAPRTHLPGAAPELPGGGRSASPRGPPPRGGPAPGSSSLPARPSVGLSVGALVPGGRLQARAPLPPPPPATPTRRPSQATRAKRARTPALTCRAESFQRAGGLDGNGRGGGKGEAPVCLAAEKQLVKPPPPPTSTCAHSRARESPLSSSFLRRASASVPPLSFSLVRGSAAMPARLTFKASPAARDPPSLPLFHPVRPSLLLLAIHRLSQVLLG